MDGMTSVTSMLDRPAAFKAAMQPHLDQLADGSADRLTVISKGDELADYYKLPKAEARRWVKEEIEKLQVSTNNASPVPLPLCASDPDPAPTPDPLDLIGDKIVGLIERRVHCSKHVAVGTALWGIGTWGVFPPSNPSCGPDLYPRLHLFSPTKRCGKSTLLETVSYFVRRPLRANDISEAAIYRSVEAWHPTFITDEVDRLLAKNRDLVGIMNSGYSRIGHVVRTVEVQRQGLRTFEPAVFSSFTPMALAGIGRIPGTIEDRSIRVQMERQPIDQTRPRVSFQQLANAQRKLGSHLVAHADAIGVAMARGVPDSAIPPSLNDRDADNWRPLLGLAQFMGGDWPERARQAAIALCNDSSNVGDRSNEWALQQIMEFVNERRRAIVEQFQAWVRNGRKVAPPRPSRFTYVVSEELAAWLLDKDDSGFSDSKDTGIVKLRAARVLGGFGVRPGLQRMGMSNPKRGYRVRDLRAVWRRYRP